jgi:hypothetical protein
MIPDSRLPIPTILWIVVAGVVCRIAANFPLQTIFRREETCGIAAAVQTAGICKIKRSEKSSSAAKCSKKNIQVNELNLQPAQPSTASQNASPPL